MSVDIIEQHWRDNYQKLSKRLAWRTGSPASGEDVLQEAYYRALRYIDSYNPEGDFNKWFGTILRNCISEHHNSEKGYSAIIKDEDDEGYECPAYDKHIMRDVYALLETKSPIQKEVISLYLKQEYTAKSISEITDYSYSRCYKIVHRFRAELKELYQDE